MMKKRVFILAMAVGMLLSFTVSAWATNYYMIQATAAAFKTLYNVTTDGGREFDIPIQAMYNATETLNTQFGSSSNASKLKFAVKEETGTFEDLEIDTDTFTLANPEATKIVTAKLTGKAKTSGKLTVTATLYKSDGTTPATPDALTEYNAMSLTATINFSTEDKDDEVDPNFMSDEPYGKATKVYPGSNVTGTTGDPESATWDGKDPTFGTMGGNDKDKPKVATSKLVFTGTGYSANAKALKSGVPASFDIEIQGPGPLINVYVSAKDAKKLWPLSCDKKLNETDPPKDWDEDIPLTKENIKKWHIPFRVTVESLDTGASQDKNTKHTLTIAYNGAQVAYKGFPITVSAVNDKTADSKGNQKPVTKTYKIDIVSGRQVPQWVTATGKIGDDLAKKNAQEISVALASGGTLGGVIYTVSADGPYYITSKGDKIGMSADVTQPELNRFGEVVTPGYVKVHGTFDKGDKGTKGGTKETKVAFTLDANGSVKKTTFKPTVIGKVSPYFEAKNLMSGDNNGKETSYAGMPHVYDETAKKYTYDGWYKVKTAEVGRVPSVKFAAKGSKTITYSLVSGGENLAQYGLSFDAKKGQIIQLTNGKDKVPTKATTSEGEYEPVEIVVQADNGVGSPASVHALVGVTGAKAKPYLGQGSDGKELKNLAIPQNSAEGTIFTIGSIIGKNVATTSSMDVNVQFRLADAKEKIVGGENMGLEDTYALEQLGLQFIPSDEFDDNFDGYDGEYRNCGVIKVYGPLTATKGTKVNLILSNLGNEQKGSVTIAIVDAAPAITGKSAIDVTLSDDAVTETYTLSAGEPTNSAKISWKIAEKELSDGIKADVKADKDDDTVATLTVKVDPKKAKVGDVSTLSITAQNGESKLTSDKFAVTITVKEAAGGGEETPTDGQAAPKAMGHAGGKVEANEETDAEDENTEDETDETEETEGSVVFGEIRTVEQLTAGQKAFLAEKGYTVVAVLPEVKATADGQYEFEVELDEDAPEGAKLIWLAFPKDAEENEDDKIADFYDKSGEAIEEVPAGKVIVVAPWLRADVTYQPVIAVEN